MVQNGIMEIVREGIWDRGGNTVSYAVVRMGRGNGAGNVNGKRSMTGE